MPESLIMPCQGQGKAMKHVPLDATDQIDNSDHQTWLASRGKFVLVFLGLDTHVMRQTEGTLILDHLSTVPFVTQSVHQPFILGLGSHEGSDLNKVVEFLHR